MSQSLAIIAPVALWDTVVGMLGALDFTVLGGVHLIDADGVTTHCGTQFDALSVEQIAIATGAATPDIEGYEPAQIEALVSAISTKVGTVKERVFDDLIADLGLSRPQVDLA